MVGPSEFLARRAIVATLFAVLAAGCGESSTAPSAAAINATTTALSIRFLHEETSGTGQDPILAGTVRLTVGTTVITTAIVQPGTGWMQPRPLAVPRDAVVHCVIDYPAWTAAHLGSMPAGTASVDLTTTTATMARYVVVPVTGPARDAGPIPGE